MSREVAIPFHPPTDESVTYRYQATDTKNGATTMTWSVDRFHFEEDGEGYRLRVEPVSSGSNERDPRKLKVYQRLEELTKLPFVLKISADARITELERGDEYWATIISALRQAFAGETASEAESKAIAAVVDMFEQMPPDVRLAALTEQTQPLLEFGLVQLTIGEPLLAQIDVASPFGGTLKQDVVISLVKIEKGLAHLTIRSSVPRAELEKLTSAVISRLGKESITREQQAKADAQLKGLKDFSLETVADYRVSTEDGMLETFESKQTTTFVEADKRTVRIKTMSLTRVW